MRAAAFAWTAEHDQALIKANVDDDMTSPAIAEAWKAPPRCIRRRVTRLGLWSRLTPEQRRSRKAATAELARAGCLAIRIEHGDFVWTREREAELRRLYVDEGLLVEDVARRMGCKPTTVSKKASLMGLAALRSADAHQRQRSAITAQVNARRWATPKAVSSPISTVSDAELIAVAIAAGKVTVLAPAWARGTTRWEGLLRSSIGDQVGGFRFGGGGRA